MLDEINCKNTNGAVISMYNEERKREFLETKRLAGNSMGIMLNLFKRVAEHERACGCDFAEMSEAQMSKAVSDVSGLSRKTIYAAESALRDYVRWCASKGYIEETVKDVKADVSERIRQSMVCSPDDLLSTLNAVFPEPEINGINYIYRSYLWLAFSGLEEQEAIRVEPEHLFFDEMKILKLYGNFSEYVIYPESVNDLKKASSMMQICENRGKKGISLVWKDRASGNQILRGKATDKPIEEVLVSSVRPLVSRAFAKAAKNAAEGIRFNLSYRRAYMSGIFYREYMGELEGIRPNFSKYAYLDFCNRNQKDGYKLKRGYTEEHVLSILRKSYEEDYLRWKEAFGLKVQRQLLPV